MTEPDGGMMKKIINIFTLVCIILLSVSCSKKPHDEFAKYRSQSAYAIFTSGERYLAKKNYSRAIKNFEALDAIYPFGAYSQQGQLDIIYAYYMDNDDASSIAAAQRYIHLYPRGRSVDYAYYMQGIVGFTLGLSWLQKAVGTNPAPRDVSTLSQSFSAFSLLVKYFPKSYYAPDSLLRMAYIRNLMAEREVLIAQYYMNRGAYVAAANRGSYVVQHFEGSPQVVPALAIMVKAYRKLGLNQMADNSYQILLANYPNSQVARQLRKA